MDMFTGQKVTFAGGGAGSGGGGMLGWLGGALGIGAGAGVRRDWWRHVQGWRRRLRQTPQRNYSSDSERCRSAA